MPNNLFISGKPILDASLQVLLLEVLACSPQLGGEDGLRCAGTQSDLLQGQPLDFTPEEQALVLRWQGMEGLHDDLQHLHQQDAPQRNARYPGGTGHRVLRQRLCDYPSISSPLSFLCNYRRFAPVHLNTACRCEFRASRHEASAIREAQSSRCLVADFCRAMRPVTS